METTRLLCMAAIVLLSLVLPLTATGRPARCTAIVLKGQLLAALGGLLTIVPALHPLWGLAVAVAAVVVYRRRLLRISA